MKKQPPKYDTSSALKKLREAGVSRRQAETHVEIISDALENVATKADLEQMENSLIAEIDQGNKLILQQMNFMKEGFNQQVEFLRDDFNQKMEKYFYKLLVLLPAAGVSLLAVYDYLKDKFS